MRVYVYIYKFLYLWLYVKRNDIREGCRSRSFEKFEEMGFRVRMEKLVMVRSRDFFFIVIGRKI